MVSQAVRSLIRPWQCGQYGSRLLFCFEGLKSKLLCEAEAEARGMGEQPGSRTGRPGGDRLTGRDVKRKRAR